MRCVIPGLLQISPPSFTPKPPPQNLPADPTAQTTQPTDIIMAKIKSVRYYRVKPRWLMVKITDENGEYGWGEATLEGHDLAVEGTLEEMIPRIVGLEAK